MSSKLKSISSQRNVARSMGQISQQLGVAMQQMDTMAIASSMDVFERQLSELDVQGTMISTVMDESTASSTPVDDVDALLMAVADENSINLAEKFPDIQMMNNPNAEAAAGGRAADTQEDELMRRLEQLR
eukprot:SAG31_NODE_1489_length_8135_cov_3.382558_4_plen_130_part_00